VGKENKEEPPDSGDRRGEREEHLDEQEAGKGTGEEWRAEEEFYLASPGEVKFKEGARKRGDTNWTSRGKEGGRTRDATVLSGYASRCGLCRISTLPKLGGPKAHYLGKNETN